jgi:DNA-binding NarL/FixJ family response regulator
VASLVRVLVVDDYEPFRRFVCLTLAAKPEFQIIAEAADGLEAVTKSEELRPDLVILDVGLPNLNGIEAARQILDVLPECKILFVSQESSSEVVREALSLGALGYIVKARAGREFLLAVETVCQGNRFLGSGLSGEAVT